jgi:hypothetical protein
MLLKASLHRNSIHNYDDESHHMTAFIQSHVGMSPVSDFKSSYQPNLGAYDSNRNRGFRGQANYYDKNKQIGSDFAQKKAYELNTMAMIAMKKKEKNLLHNLKMQNK